MAELYSNPEKDPSNEQLLVAVYKEVLEVKDLLLDIQKRQIKTTALVEEVEKKEAEVPQVGSFATGYQKT